MKFKRSKADIRRRRILANAMNLKGKAIMKSVGESQENLEKDSRRIVFQDGKRRGKKG